MPGQPLHLRITLVTPPAGVLYSLQKDDAPVGQAMSDGGDLSLDVTVSFVEDDRGVRYLGPFVKNQGGRRFVYYRVGTSAGQHDSPWSRRGKVWFEDLPVDLAREAAATGRRLEARFPGVAKDGGPSCATVRPIGGWRVIG
ncbi:MAG TPA: DUF5990 family protein, partial [Caulobacter sp.]|nr:DUF5990 family protein [Caulobacter sp.]